MCSEGLSDIGNCTHGMGILLAMELLVNNIEGRIVGSRDKLEQCKACLGGCCCCSNNTLVGGAIL